MFLLLSKFRLFKNRLVRKWRFSELSGSRVIWRKTKARDTRAQSWGLRLEPGSEGAGLARDSPLPGCGDSADTEVWPMAGDRPSAPPPHRAGPLLRAPVRSPPASRALIAALARLSRPAPSPRARARVAQPWQRPIQPSGCLSFLYAD
ncbi:hypothetical protein HispidOSU_021813 [Sigmodon hispidus]